jgi:hypothetical protein
VEAGIVSDRLDKYRQALRKLRSACPVSKPVRVRRRLGPNPLDSDGKACCGFVNLSRDKRHLNLTVFDRYGARRQTAEELQDVAIHEWAHAMAWDLENADGIHGSAWGLAYSRAYLAVVEG